jgi:hypothetical protein
MTLLNLKPAERPRRIPSYTNRNAPSQAIILGARRHPGFASKLAVAIAPPWTPSARRGRGNDLGAA